MGRSQERVRLNRACTPSPMDQPNEPFTCRWCGCVHVPVSLRVGERAMCVNCGSVVARRPKSEHTSLAFTLTAAILAIPAAEFPLVTVRKLGAERTSYLWTSVTALWQHGMPLLSVWVALCGIIVPLVLLAALFAIAASARTEAAVHPHKIWMRAARALHRWSMPEVQVLAVLVAFVKIGALVDVAPGPGLWFYAAMAAALLVAWRSAGPPQEAT